MNGNSYLVERKEFTVEEGIAVQTENLNAWKLVLKEEIYLRVEKWSKETNDQAKNGYQIRRGGDISCYINNIATELYYDVQPNVE